MHKEYATLNSNLPFAPYDGRTDIGVSKGADMKFEIYKDKAGEFRFRIVATNGNILASSEGYSAKASAKNAIERIKSDAAKAEIVDNS